MKKTLLIGVLAAFAISALSIQDLGAQNPVKKAKTDQKEVKAINHKADQSSVNKDIPTKRVETNASKDCPQACPSSENASQNSKVSKQQKLSTSKSQPAAQSNAVKRPKAKKATPSTKLSDKR